MLTRSLLALAALFVAAQPARAEIALFSQRNFQGARYALDHDSSNMNFSPRSVRVVVGDKWRLCPRPFFGGNCITIEENNPALGLPRSFSGVVRSARRITAKSPPAAVKPPVVPAEHKAQEKPHPDQQHPEMPKAPEKQQPEKQPDTKKPEVKAPPEKALPAKTSPEKALPYKEKAAPDAKPEVKAQEKAHKPEAAKAGEKAPQ